MPIRSENRRFYSTPAFGALRDLLRARSGDRCERCKAPNGERVAFLAGPQGAWFSEGLRRWVNPDGDYLNPATLRASKSLLRFYPLDLLDKDPVLVHWVDVVCGVAHLDHDPRHQDPLRCAWLCARCHLAHDAKDNHARARRYAAQESGQLWLDEEIEKAAAPEASG